jgi:AraC-like DNA-binding protein
MDVLEVISIVGAVQGLLLAVYFSQKSKNRISSLMLGLYLFVFSIGLLERWVAGYRHSYVATVFLDLIAYCSYLYGPFLFLFIFYLASGISSFQKKHLIHFLPFGIFYGIRLFIFISNFRVNDNLGNVTELIEFEILVIQILGYNLFAIKQLSARGVKAAEKNTGNRKEDIGSLRLVLVVITGIYCFSFLLSHLAILGIKEVSDLFVVVRISIPVGIYAMSYVILVRPGVFIPSSIQPDTVIINTTPVNEIRSSQSASVFSKYERSGLKPDEAQTKLFALQKLMENEKPFKNPNLNISLLSQALFTSKNHLTQVLNQELKMNFYEFVNAYRVGEAKRMLTDPGYAHLSLEGIAKECGYRSKATFFLNFRKITGLTPQQWVKSL